jgi:hypothetical protein
VFQHWLDAESIPGSQLCVNTLPATNISVITNGILFGSLRVNYSCPRHVAALSVSSVYGFCSDIADSRFILNDRLENQQSKRNKNCNFAYA